MNPPQPDPEYSSPACFLHELDQTSLPDPPPDQTAEQGWEDVRLWRKAKRQLLICRRLALSRADRDAASARITVRLYDRLKNTSGCLGFYWSLKGEYDPLPLCRMLHVQGIQLALPVVVGKAQPLIFRHWHPGTKMEVGLWNIPIPAEAEPVRPDTLLVPAVGLDNKNYRMGYGGGFYDRTIANLQPPPRTIGIAFACCRLRTIYPQPHDAPMDEVVIE